MNITSTNTTSRNIALQNVDFDKNATTNVHAVIRDEDNLTNQVDVESNITKSINAVSIDWNKVKFNSTRAKLPSVVSNESSLLFDNDFLKQIVNDGIFETSQLIRMLEIYAEVLSTFIFYIGNLTYKNSNNEIIEFTIANDGNNEQLIHSIIDTLKSESKIEYIRTESDIYAPKSNPVVVDNEEYYVRIIPDDRLFMICPKFMYDSFINSYKIPDQQFHAQKCIM